MAGIDKKDGQFFDGVSVVPALTKGDRLKREAIFCHFPHYVPATNNLPSTYVRKGPWKLIRFYGEGPERSNGYELYNLVEDVGEKNNLAQKLPGKVAELDRLIDEFLADTGAIVPAKNPAYAPNLRGWAPSRNCNVSTGDGLLTVNSTGNDPYISCANVPGQVRMREATGCSSGPTRGARISGPPKGSVSISRTTGSGVSIPFRSRPEQPSRQSASIRATRRAGSSSTGSDSRPEPVKHSQAGIWTATDKGMCSSGTESKFRIGHSEPIRLRSG